jgi:hypothetical protein
MHTRLALAAFGGLIATTVAATAPDHVTPITALVDDTLRAEISTPAVLAALKARNAENGGVDQARVDALDLQWRAEVKAGDGPLVNAAMTHPVSADLRALQAKHEGLLTEIFIMDNLGLNLAQSDPTSDYWQGDEAKWQKTYAVGPQAVFIDEIEFDDSSQAMQAQVSFSIADPATGETVGAVTVGIDVDMLLQ